MERIPFLLALLMMSLAACAPKAAPTLTVMTHDSFAAREAVIASFEQAYNVDVTFLRLGDAGEMLNKAILSKDVPLADIL